MKYWIRGFAVVMSFSVLALGQATPVSSGPDQSPPPAAAPQQKTIHTHKAKAHHAKAHHSSHKKHHKSA